MAAKYRERYVDPVTLEFVDNGAPPPPEEQVNQAVLDAYRSLRAEFSRIRAKVFPIIQQAETDLPRGGPSTPDSTILVYLLASTIVRMTQPQVASPFTRQQSSQTASDGMKDLLRQFIEIARETAKPDPFGLDHEKEE